MNMWIGDKTVSCTIGVNFFFLGVWGVIFKWDSQSVSFIKEDDYKGDRYRVSPVGGAVQVVLFDFSQVYTAPKQWT